MSLPISTYTFEFLVEVHKCIELNEIIPKKTKSHKIKLPKIHINQMKLKVRLCVFKYMFSLYTITIFFQLAWQAAWFYQRNFEQLILNPKYL